MARIIAIKRENDEVWVQVGLDPTDTKPLYIVTEDDLKYRFENKVRELQDKFNEIFQKEYL